MLMFFRDPNPGKILNGIKFGWKTKALKSINSVKSEANLMNMKKYAPIQTFFSGTGTRTNMRKILFYGAGERQLTTQIKEARGN